MHFFRSFVVSLSFFNCIHCHRLIPSRDRKRHEEQCHPPHIRCPTIPLAFCGWMGPKQDASKHCEEQHPEIPIFETYEVDSRLFQKLRQHLNTHFLMYTYDNFFYCNVTANGSEYEKLRVSVYLLGTPVEAQKYKVTAIVEMHKGQCKAAFSKTLNERCGSFTDHYESPVAMSFAEDVPDSCCKEFPIHYKIAIDDID